MGEAACCVWDFTFWGVEGGAGIVKEWLEGVAKGWCFQLEQAPNPAPDSDGRHFQGRLSLKEKQREFWWGAGKECECPEVFKAHFSRTSGANRNNMFYVMKKETRVEGPWADTDPKEIYIPQQVRKIKLWYPWQQYIFGLAYSFDERHIWMIGDRGGGIGKSTLVTAMICSGLWEELPPCNSYKDINRAVATIGPKKGYVIDMPRGLPKSELAGFWAGIESIKNGRAWDDRYKWKRIIFDCPAIVVFTNVAPDWDLLSGDRWVCCHVGSDQSLVRVERGGFCGATL